ncbi:NADPH-dependent ferric siderophore reductase, contains FAD-binding and SIP domains [Chryseobacterium oleae]|uniref:NADPH-dependent ferric siderophore reductase, contains FAD-binding and SIP domains n=1 Tax=Chryseobacterium oleae TaxID=491207 RepID=A0A1I4VVL8_CHROL|nr:siderophore-interacting protein [Chryseobacterium oleae]SFN05056.1 NADPH-dependent ferric siderophore reductase, contains FAD-binding and SIP domains [Chryseobacterium oleae]
MPSLPKWINDTLENVMSSKFKECTVIHTEPVSNDLRLVRFASDLEDVPFEPAYAIGIRVNERDYRNYSPFNFNKHTGTFDVIFHLHDTDSVGGRFANNLSEGDTTKILMPRGKRFFEINAEIHFSIGDETSLGSSMSIKEAAEEIGGSFVCLHELEEASTLKDLELYGYHAPKNDIQNIMEALDDFLKEEKEAVYNNEAVFYLTGNGNTMSVIRKFLKAKGVDAKCIRSQAYWIEGKKGL